MTIDEKFAVLQNEYTHLMGKHVMMKIDYKYQLMDEKKIMLDKIKAEIENDWQLKKYPSSQFSCGLRRAIEIIDQYKEENEE